MENWYFIENSTVNHSFWPFLVFEMSHSGLSQFWDNCLVRQEEKLNMHDFFISLMLFFVNTCQSTYEFVFWLALGDLECSWRSQRSKRSNFKKCCKLSETHGLYMENWYFIENSTVNHSFGNFLFLKCPIQDLVNFEIIAWFAKK